MKSAIAKHSVVIAHHKTSVSLETEFWQSLKEIAKTRQSPLSNVLSAIKGNCQVGNLSSAIRLHVLDFYREQMSP